MIGLSFPITGLANATVYHFRIVAANSLGTNFYADSWFLTGPLAPVVVTLPATGVTAGQAVLNASVNPNGARTSLYFDYGTTTNYGNSTPPEGVPNIGLNFNGSNQSANSVAPLSGLAPGNTPHTIEVWLNPTLVTPGQEAVLVLGADGGAHIWLSANGSAEIGSSYGALTTTLPANVWSHVAATFDGDLLAVYINGSLLNYFHNAYFDLQGVSLSLAQGSSDNYPSYYAGGMDEVRIWDRALADYEIEVNLNHSFSGDEPDLVAYYRLDEGSGTTLIDATGHGNNLQSTNSLSWATGASIEGAPVKQTYPAQAVISGLTPGTLYHYRAAAENSEGTNFGVDLTFTALPPAASTPLILASPIRLGDGSFQFYFTNTPGASFTVLSTTNLGLPQSNWTVSSNVVESPGGQFHFNDPQATNNGQRFYRVRSP